jgi:hypothetical protein
MADRHLYRRTLAGFVPFNDDAQDQFGKCKLGDVVELKPTKVRNGKFHRLFFAMLKLIAENSNPEVTPRQALFFAKVAADCGEWVKDTRGQAHFIEGSIAFGAMDQNAFDAFVKAAIPPLVARFMRGTAPEALVNEAMEIAA